MTTPATTLAPEVEARFATARQVADAVLFEGYVLYPYRASAAKNRLRWQFGVLVPPAFGADSGEHAFQRTQCLMEPRRGATLFVELRFLHAQRRLVQRALPEGGYENVPELELADRVLTAWDEGVEERVQLAVPLAELSGEGRTFPFTRPVHEETEAVYDEAGQLVGRLLRRREEIHGVVRLTADELPGPYAVQRLTAVVENTADWRPGLVDSDRSGCSEHADRSDRSERSDREAALPRSLVSAHVMLGLSAGSFLSMADPPEWAKGEAAACENLHTWPVLAGEAGRTDVLLSSPIILEDHPAIAPESPGALYDALEIDEILALRTAALTDQEKREARGTDARAAAVIELADTMPPEVLERLHGAVRSLREITEPAAAEDDLMQPQNPWWDPASDAAFDPARDRVVVDGRSVGAGSRVRLRPGQRRTDAQDLFLHGRDALVEAVLHDVDGGVHLAVTVEGDPGADIRREQGRFLYFQPDEVAPLEDL